ncbi:Alpha/Beta hydrolase protein [Hyaloscypha sp. PMI_1271]|nr:Alpha/Beta hydrolase protein [Hyaloscypha sp. PMI_1271]
MAELATSPQSRSSAPPPSLWGWISLLSKATGITITVFLHALKTLARPPKNDRTTRQQIAYTGIRIYQSSLPATSIQNLRPSTTTTCKKFAKKHHVRHSPIQLPDGTIACWIGPKDALKVVVVFHGGGYMAAALTEHISIGFAFSKPTRKDLAVVVLQYSLASENASHHPIQLQQAVSLLQHLLYDLNIPSSSITLIGDSAGGHLLLSLLLHLTHPNPLTAPIKLEIKFSSAVLISPWVTVSTSATSMKLNQEKDILTISGLEYWGRNFLGGKEMDCWNTPLMAQGEWWGEVPCEEMLVLYGEDELFRDDIEEFCAKLTANHAKTTALKFANEIHVHMVMNRFLKINKPCESEKVFVKWMNEHLGSR